MKTNVLGVLLVAFNREEKETEKGCLKLGKLAGRSVFSFENHLGVL